MADYPPLDYDPRGVPNTRLRQFLFGLDRLGTGGLLTGQRGNAGGGVEQIGADLIRPALPTIKAAGNYGLNSMGAFADAVKSFALDDPDVVSRGPGAPANPNPSTVAPAAPSTGNVRKPDVDATPVASPTDFPKPVTSPATPAREFAKGVSAVDFSAPVKGTPGGFYKTMTESRGGAENPDVPLYTNYNPEQGSPDIKSGTPQFSNPESDQNAMIEKMFQSMMQRKMEDPFGVQAYGARAKAEYDATHPAMSPEEMAPLDQIQSQIQTKQEQAANMEALLTKAGKNPNQDPMYNKLLQEIGQLHETLSTNLQMADFRRGNRLQSSTPRMLGVNNGYQ